MIDDIFQRFFHYVVKGVFSTVMNVAEVNYKSLFDKLYVVAVLVGKMRKGIEICIDVFHA